jgi:bifunctional N-acetylglucosamine-1-phosphate-uridyltransferase/glucosamine-1-phosphate-acetyltransferase GlmU-like protein
MENDTFGMEKNMKTTLVIMAAGMGSRYGGLKQMDPVGPNGEFILDYSVYDAINAGFNKVVFVINESIKKEFKDIVGSRLEQHIEVAYAIQRLDDIPVHDQSFVKRIKPWGTAHAVYAAREVIEGDFAVINADDYYGRTSFELVNQFLTDSFQENEQALIGFRLKNTVTDSGSVSRGICVTEGDYLIRIDERTEIIKDDESYYYIEDGEHQLDENVITSMNMWGFKHDFLMSIEKELSNFLNCLDDILKSEYYLPLVVQKFIDVELGKVKVIETNEQWLGVTYSIDRANVVSTLKELTDSEFYPDGLWRHKDD